MSNTKETATGNAVRDYRETLSLPKTDFSMKANLPVREPEWLARWEKTDLYACLREAGKGREKFIYHDGPPYANGDIHMGHALNKVLKDIVVRSQQMMGKDCAFVPGWDCHGLPIEWKIEEKYRARGLSKDEVPVLEFRQECRDFASHWIEIQKENFKRLGILADWENPYTTMAHDAEATTVAEFHKFVMDGSLYRGSKPVMWSMVEKTALAEAEIEYHERTSPTIWVRFPVLSGEAGLEKASIVIWTTTPWTIPCNRAIAYSGRIAYGVYQVGAVGEFSRAQSGEILIIADSLATQVRQDMKVESWTRLRDAPDLDGTICAHPLRHQGYDFDVPLYDGSFVTEEAGTGFVHIAPGHGLDDYNLWMIKNPSGDIPCLVDEAGMYRENVPLFAGRCILKSNGKEGDANGAVTEALAEAGGLAARGKLKHSYPHSWRSKAPLFFRNTPQWFVSMEKTGLRETALKALEKVRFTPESGKKRLRVMIETRPDWVLSRQRAWGVPLAVFVCRKTGDLLRDEAVNKRIEAAICTRGCDVWFEEDARFFLGDDYDPDDYEMVHDILDVWFDSGTTHAFVLEARENLDSPADLYLEGSDQHRGWFQSSLLESCATRGRAPYKQIVTHGFLLDEKGHKMSKSGTNAVQPDKTIRQNGAEIIRIWAGSSDYTEDMRIGPEVIKSHVDIYRKLRNTFRFLLGNLNDFTYEDRLTPAEMPELERYMLHHLHELDALVRSAYSTFDFKRAFQSLFNFMTVDLSAFYFDIRKDVLYCDLAHSVTRRATQTVLDELLNCLAIWLAPVLCFTAEEVWFTRYPGDTHSVHLQTFPEIPAEWCDAPLAAKWQKIRALRRVVTGALEIERREKRIGSSLEAAPVIYVQEPASREAMDGIDLPEIMITSQASLVAGEGPREAFRLSDVPGVAVVPERAQGRKCRRSWKILPEVGSVPGYPDLSPRDAQAVAALDGAL